MTSAPRCSISFGVDEQTAFSSADRQLHMAVASVRLSLMLQDLLPIAGDGLGFTSGNNVLTLVQTANGIQVRAPDGRRALPVAAARPPPPVIGLLSSQIGLADAILTSDEASAITTSEERTQKVLHPKVVHAPPSGLDKPAVGGRTSRIPRSHVPTPKQPSRARPLSRLRSGLSRLQRRQSSSHNRRPSAAPIA